ncbi:MAG: hypothetical protein J2P15_00805, partial [Micromonosporaceae bacterium]|nr:hypothetical protein [Micromonosporaceae bacterium]
MPRNTPDVEPWPQRQRWPHHETRELVVQPESPPVPRALEPLGRPEAGPEGGRRPRRWARRLAVTAVASTAVGVLAISGGLFARDVLAPVAGTAGAPAVPLPAPSSAG